MHVQPQTMHNVKDTKIQCRACSQVVAALAGLLLSVAGSTPRAAAAAQDM
jgi:hypothetical protein